ncbi:MAG: glucose-6-phosphate dehydrogenase assembly protein OpcA [Actinomycetales bacterium]|nr:glucose-6-phosphate dehydrogenase assembly protein OpcA [Actinomycetales bacterium]
MMRLEDTTVAAISEAIREEKSRKGAIAVGMVLTLIVVADEADQADALHAASAAASEHPMRILGIIPRPGRTEAQLDAEISVAGADGPGEVIALRLRGAMAAHTASVALPLLVPDAPVVVWWASDAPKSPVKDPLGQLARRRITDASLAGRSRAELQVHATQYAPGDTDLAWTRTTPWRALLAAALDRPHARVTGAEVHASRSNPSAPLLAAWLHSCLGVPVTMRASRGPGLTAVHLHTDTGDISITRPDGTKAILQVPGYPASEVALRRRETRDLLLEELRRLDPDEVYAQALALSPQFHADGP